MEKLTTFNLDFAAIGPAIVGLTKRLEAQRVLLEEALEVNDEAVILSCTDTINELLPKLQALLELNNKITQFFSNRIIFYDLFLLSGHKKMLRRLSQTSKHFS